MGLPARLAAAIAMAVVTMSVVSLAPAAAQGFRLQPTISTTATPEAIVGGSIFDTANVTGPAGAPAPTGAVTFAVYHGDVPCAGSPVFLSAHRVLSGAPPTATSTAFTPSSAGFYYWVVTYIGDANYLPATSACGAFGETSNVSAAKPTLVTRATPTAAVGQPITDTATLSGGFNPTGTITFRLFSDPVCSTAPLFVSVPVPVNGNGNYTSPPVAVTATGSYFWKTDYSGDQNNLGIQNPCQDANETSVIVRVTPTVVAQAVPPGPVNVGQPISGTATLSGASNPTGSITFRAFGPNDATCAAAPVFRRTVQVTGNGNYSSGFFTPAAGRYNWVATYSGDHYNPAAASTCGAPHATSIVNAVVTMTTTAAPHVSLGSPISDTARITVQSGLPAPTGTVRFTLYGPNDANCSRQPVFTSDDQPVSGGPPTATATSGPFAPTQGGDYRWTARYSGNDVYPPLASACNDLNETSLVDSRVATLTAQATPSATIGQPINDTATLSGAFNPTGTMTFTAFGPDNPTCIGAGAFKTTVPAALTTRSGNFTPPAAGTYNWIVAYSGDANHEPLRTACGDPGSITTVHRAQPALATRATPTATVGTQVSGTVVVTGPATAAAPTGTVTFAVYGPSDPTCAGAAVFTSANRPLSRSTRPVATSAKFTPEAPGAYRWVVFYSGDANYLPATSPCNAPGATSTVTKRSSTS